jgi:glycerol-3-phosphate acyltransferase PlsY
MPQVTALVFAVWFVIVRVSRYVSLGSIVAAACVPLAAVFWQQPGEYIFFSLLAAIFVIYRHKANIGRLLEGTETKIKAKQRP